MCCSYIWICGQFFDFILANMKQITRTRLYQVLAMLGVVILYTYIILVVLFVFYVMMTAYDHILSVSTAVLVY